jgi:hypothetical protein
MAMAVATAMIIVAAVFIPSFVTAVIVPVVAVPVITAIANDHLVAAPAIPNVPRPYVSVMHPGPWLI